MSMRASGARQCDRGRVNHDARHAPQRKQQSQPILRERAAPVSGRIRHGKALVHGGAAEACRVIPADDVAVGLKSHLGEWPLQGMPGNGIDIISRTGRGAPRNGVREENNDERVHSWSEKVRDDAQNRVDADIETRLLAHFTQSGGEEILAVLDEASWQTPSPPEESPLSPSSKEDTSLVLDQDNNPRKGIAGT